MNAKEMEALIIAQGQKIEELMARIQTDPIPALGEAHMHLVQRLDNIVEGFKKELAGRDERIRLLEELHDARRNEIEALTAQVTLTQEAQYEVRGTAVEALEQSMGNSSRIETLEKLVLARNSSAATKRNMTDDDAMRVLTGDVKDLSHKNAAEKIGLTYAQVYSCRLEFTFKHVHKDLRDKGVDNQPWKNNWVK